MSILLSGEEILTMAMEIEKSGKAFYTTTAERAENEDMKSFFRFLAEEEERHYGYFCELSRTAPELIIDQGDWDEVSDYIKAATDSRFFIGEDRAIQHAKNASGMLEAVDTAIGFEKDTLLFFYELLQITPESSRKAAKEIIDEEKRHIKMLADKRKELAG